MLPTASAHAAKPNSSFFQVMEAHGRSVLLWAAGEDIIIIFFFCAITLQYNFLQICFEYLMSTRFLHTFINEADSFKKKIV